MSTFQVETTPQRINLGNTPTPLTILNDGPATVFLSGDSGSATSAYNSFRLPPLATMDWQGGEELYAAVAKYPGTLSSLGGSPLSRLIINEKGKLSVLNSINTSRLLAKTNGVSNLLVETSAFSSLIITLTLTHSDFLQNTNAQYRVVWYSEEGIVTADHVYTEYVNGDGAAGAPNTLIVPVEGYYASVSVQRISGTAWSGLKFAVYGSMSDRGESYSWGLVADGIEGSTFSIFRYANSFSISNYNTALSPGIMLSPMSKRLEITVFYDSAMTGGNVVLLGIDNVVYNYGQLNLAAGVQATHLTFQQGIDRAMSVYVAGTGTVRISGSFV